MKSKEALKDISYLLLNEVDELKNKDIWKNDINIIKKDLEVLDLIKAKSVNPNLIKVTANARSYNLYVMRQGTVVPDPNLSLTDEEFEKIREWQNNKEKEKQDIEFNVYDMLVFEDESGSIYQDCVCSVCNDITNNGYSAPFHKAIICERFIIDFKEEDENTIDRIATRDEILEDFHTFKLKEIWTRTDEDTYKKVWENK